MDSVQTRRLWLTLGGGVAVLGAALAAGLIVLTHAPRGAAPPAAATGGLVVQAQSGQEARLDTQRPLRCFVNGQFIGEESLADCARRNGVATEALDVGVDQTRQAAPPDQAAEVAPAEPASASPPTAAIPAPIAAEAPATGDCLRATGPAWRKVGAGMSLSGCVKLLFAGQCQKSAGATYGRWMSQTLRLVPGAVEISSDNSNFRVLVEQPASCAIPDF